MNKSVLIFDDDQEILQVCKIILEQQNYQVATRNHCNDVVKDVNDVKPGIVLMDLWIPEKGGEHAIAILKNEAAHAHIPIILFSANDKIEDIASRCGASGFLRKPFKIIDLLNMIENKYCFQLS